jgi:radical SAM protein with 4Fe4S-binding SPASM domain
MQEELAEEAVDLALALPTNDLTIEFAGGEPLLRFPLLQRLIERIELASAVRSQPVLIAVQTNGLLLKKEVLEFFARHPGVEVGISLDGPSRLNDLARVAADGQGRHAAIEDAARAAVSLWGKQAGALAVIHSASVAKPAEMAAYFASLGLGKMRLNPMVRLGRGSAEGASLAVSPAQYLSFMERMLDYLAETPAFEESNLEALVRNLILKSREYRCMRSPCGAGYDYLVVTPTGDLYPCARFIHDPDLFLGNLSDAEGLEGRFMKSRLVGAMANRIVSRLPECQNCLWRHFCGGGCALAAHSISGTIDLPDPFCEFYRGIYPFLVQYLYQRPEMVGYFFKGAVACHVSPPTPGIS